MGSCNLPSRQSYKQKQIQLENEQKAWLYAAIDVDTKVVLHARLSWHRGRDPAKQFLDELKEKHRVSDAEFLVDGMGYLTALARTDLGGELNYTDRNIVEKLFPDLYDANRTVSRNLERQSDQCRALADCLHRLL